MSLPAALQDLVEFFEALPEVERRDALCAYAARLPEHLPRAGETYAVIDERHDEACLDSVGIYLHLDPEGGAVFRLRLGPEVQTLTRALAVIFSLGLRGTPPAVIVTICDNFIPRIVGSELMRLRARTVYYVWRRMQEAARGS